MAYMRLFIINSAAERLLAFIVWLRADSIRLKHCSTLKEPEIRSQLIKRDDA